MGKWKCKQNLLYTTVFGLELALGFMTDRDGSAV